MTQPPDANDDEAPVEDAQPEHTSTGDPRIAEALQRLQALGDRPPEEHVEAYEDVHRVLAETLSDAQQDRPGDRRT